MSTVPKDYLQTLAWPPAVGEQNARRQVCGGFGGTVLLPDRRTQYRPFANAGQTRCEIAKEEKLDAPLAPAKEKEQREREPPPQSEVTSETLAKDRKEADQKSELLTLEAPDVVVETAGTKRRGKKRTLF